ncbi:MAG: hypothetical protein M0010_15360 [Actinomycetota bacterium]|jgi:hypothetical protein|nr:hypothetical protein [Actinomycetota bacterium]
MTDDEVVEAEVVDPGELVADTAPKPLMRLRASIYETDAGSLLLAFRVEGMDHDIHFVANRTMVKVLAKLARVPGGNPIDLLRQAGAELGGAESAGDAD